jgi:hypothetical protein
MAKINSGGGLTSNKLVRPNVRTGPASTNKIDPRGVSQYGYATGSTLKQAGSFTGKNSALPVNAGTTTQVPMGNAVARNVGAGGPGAGRTIHRTGTQMMHGQPVGSPVQGREILGSYGPETSGASTVRRRRWPSTKR